MGVGFRIWDFICLEWVRRSELRIEDICQAVDNINFAHDGQRGMDSRNPRPKRKRFRL